MLVEIEGELNDKGMVMDYYDLRDVIDPIVEELDHSFMANEKDLPVVEFLEKMKSKRMIVDFDSTVENITTYFLNKIKNAKLPSNIKKLKVRVCETPDDYAEEEITLK